MRWLSLVLCVWLGAAPVSAQSNAAEQQSERVARLIARGQAARDAGNIISALGYYRDAIGAAPRRSEGYVALGRLYLELEEPTRALEVFETGTRAVRDSEPVWLGLADTLNRLGQSERALAALRHVRATAPSVAAFEALASTAEAHGAFVEALAARRARLEALHGDAEAEARERPQVRALELLLGPADRAREPSACADSSAGPVLRALARCRAPAL